MHLKDKELTLICQPSDDRKNLLCWLGDERQDEESGSSETDGLVMEILGINEPASCQVKIHPGMKLLLSDESVRAPTLHDLGAIVSFLALQLPRTQRRQKDLYICNP